MELDVRKLEDFLAVAERLHFGRAAQARHMTQPALSRRIRQLEREVGVELFERDSRHVALTPAGEVLSREGSRLLAAIDAALLSTRRAATGELAMTVGFMLGMDVDPVLRAFSECHPEVDVRLQRLRWWNHGKAILDGEVDAGFVRLPVPSEGLTLLPLYREPVTVTLPCEHPLASKAALRLEEVTNEPVLRYADASPAWHAFWTVDPRPDGREAKHGPLVHDMEEILEYARAGRGVAFLPEVVGMAFSGRGVAFVPVPDFPPGPVVLAWSTQSPSPFLPALRQAAERVLGED